jgi:predicted O-linked N-acetylglucosamine transferase (SPINDLY family)
MSLARNSAVAAEYNRHGLDAHRAGRPADAAAAYTAALSADPDAADAYANRAAARAQLGDTKGAFDDFAAALRLRPDSPETLNNRGVLRRDLGDLAAARADFDKALELAPDYADALANRAVVHHLRWDHAAAAADLTRALAAPAGRSGVDARRHLLTVFRADAFYHLGRTADALADYRSAFADRPAAFARLVCRTIAATVRDHGAAAMLADCDRHLARDPGDFLSLARRTIIQLGLGQTTEAEAARAAAYAAGDPGRDAGMFETMLAHACEAAR